MIDLTIEQHGIYGASELEGMDFIASMRRLRHHNWSPTPPQAGDGADIFRIGHHTGAVMVLKIRFLTDDDAVIVSAVRDKDMDMIDQACFVALSARKKVLNGPADGPFPISDGFHALTKTTKAGWVLDKETHGVRYLEELIGMSTVMAASVLALGGWRCSVMNHLGDVHLMHPDGKAFSIASRWMEDAEELMPGSGKWYVDAVDDLHIATDDEIIDFMLKQGERTRDLDT